MLAILLLSAMIQSPMNIPRQFSCSLGILLYIFALNLANTYIFVFVAALPDVFFILSIMTIP